MREGASLRRGTDPGLFGNVCFFAAGRNMDMNGFSPCVEYILRSRPGFGEQDVVSDTRDVVRRTESGIATEETSGLADACLSIAVLRAP